MLNQLTRLNRVLRVGRRVTLTVSDRVTSPILIGLVRSTIVLPSAALGWPAAELEMVLVHELAHVRGYDNLVNFAQRIIESLLFFHPAVWLISRGVREEREHCCDAVVVRHTDEPRAYAELLCQLATPVGRGLSAAMAMSRTPLTARVRRILRVEDESVRVTWQPVLWTGIMALVAAVGVSCQQADGPVAAPGDEMAEPELAVPRAAELVVSAVEHPPTPSRGRNAEVISSDSGFESAMGSGMGYGPISATESSQATRVPFPTLDQQKTADRIWKAIEIEFELVSEKELSRVTKLGFDGALRVAGNDRVFGGGRGGPGFDGGGQNTRVLRAGDLLVGPHSFPISSFEAVEVILARDDLAELEPLKFYAVRAVSENGMVDVKDAVITGRLPSGYRRDARARPSNRNPMPDPGMGMGRSLGGEEGGMGGRGEMGMGMMMGESPGARESTAEVGDTVVLYDGKTFEQWQSQLRTELKWQSRVEAVDAMAVFAEAGYGPEALGTLLDVAVEFNFRVPAGSPLSPPILAIVRTLVTSASAHGFANWPMMVADRLKVDPDKWSDLATVLIKGQSPITEADFSWLIDFARYDHPLNVAALAKIYEYNGSQFTADAIPIAREILAGDDVDSYIGLLKALKFQNDPLLPGQVEAFVHPDSKIRARVRGILLHLGERRVNPDLVRQLLSILDDEERPEHHQAAIRAVFAVGPAASSDEVLDRLLTTLGRGREDLYVSAVLAGQSVLSLNADQAFAQIRQKIPATDADHWFHDNGSFEKQYELLSAEEEFAIRGPAVHEPIQPGERGFGPGGFGGGGF